MARDYIDIGSAPADEPCVQVSPTEDYLPAMRAECTRFIEFIRKHMGPEPEGVRLAIKSNPHDFGSYLEVVCYYEDTNEKATKYAFNCEGSKLPSTWDAPVELHIDPATNEALTPAKPHAYFCGSCEQAAGDEGIEDIGSMHMLLAEMGADIPDHFCDEIEDPSMGQCQCACNPEGKRRVRGLERRAA